MRRRSVELVRGMTALLTLAGLLLGLPVALVDVVGWPLPAEVPSWAAFERLLTTGELDSWTLVKALALLVWIAWAQLASSSIAEAVAIARGRRTARIPSARPFRLAATNLVATAALLFGSAARPAEAAVLPRDLHVALVTGPSGTPMSGDRADPGTHQRDSPVAGAPVLEERSRVGSSDGWNDAPVWRVAPRDTLWRIAESALGDGLRWREIHDLNLGRPQPDGRALRAGDDLIRPGWLLRLPTDAMVEQPTTGAPTSLTVPAAVAVPSTTITVNPGDTLWDLSDRHLDDPHRWPDLYDANQDRVQPDGRKLTDPDLIHPGWQLTIPTEADEPVASPSEPPPEQPPVERSELEAATPVDPLPWSQLDRDEPPPPPSERDAWAVGDVVLAEDAEERSGLLVGAGLATAGIVLTLDRLRRSRQRRRAPGQRIRPPGGALARAEWRVRGLADQQTADLLDVALRSLAADCARGGREVPAIALVSVGSDDVAVHLRESDQHPVEGWRLEDAGMTWVLPRPAELERLRDRAATALSPSPLLITIGTQLNSRRRVLLNLGHAGLVSVDGDEATARTTLLAVALELATTARADGLQILLSGAGDRFATLERIRCLPEAEALELLTRAVGNAGPDEADATAVVMLSPPAAELRNALATVADRLSGTVAAVGPRLDEATWRLDVSETTILVAPYGLELRPLELSADDVEAIGQLLVDATTPDVAGPDVAGLETFAPEPSAAHATNGRSVPSTDPSEDPVNGLGIEVRVLGPIEVVGAADFASAKAEELVVYLALREGPVDADTLQEALWPSETPNAGRLHTTVWRARQALGDSSDGEPYLPKAKQGRYQLSEAVGTDLDRFGAYVSRARSEPARAVEELRPALELVRGRPLSATSAEYAWGGNEVHSLEQDITDAAHQLAELHLELGQPQEARWAAERGLLADPYCELLYRDLMRAAAATGNTNAVHEIMRRFRRTLDLDSATNDADDVLDPATTDLYEELTRTRQGSASDPAAGAHDARRDDNGQRAALPHPASWPAAAPIEARRDSRGHRAP